METLPKAKSKAIVKTYDEVGLALEDLAKGNIDAVICDDPVAKFYANKKQEYAGKLKVASSPTMWNSTGSPSASRIRIS